MATENLKVKITADASQAKTEIGKFKDSLKGTVKEGETAIKAIGKTTAALGGMLVAVKALKSAIKTAIDVAATGDAIKDNAQKVFMGTTAYQEWGYVLKQNGIEIGALKVGMRQFAQQVASGSETLAKYGITATDVDTAFEQAIATIQNMSTETEKIAAATELFGTRALELFPILNLTNAETQSLMQTYRLIGGTMSNELIAASDSCSDSITAMRAAWGGLRNVLAAYLLPTITKVVQWITVAIAKVRILLAAIFGLKETFGGGGSKKNSLAGSTGSVATNTGNTANNLKKATKAAKELKRTLMGIDELTKLVEKATTSPSTSTAPSGGGTISVDASGMEDLASAVGEVFDDETLKKIQEFKDKVAAIAEPLNGVYLIFKGLVEISFGNFKQGLTDIKAGFEKLIPDSVKKKWGEFKKMITEKISTFVNVTWPDWKKNFKAKWDKFKKKFKAPVVKAIVQIPNWKKELKAKWDAIVGKFRSISVGVSISVSTIVSDLKSWFNTNIIDRINRSLQGMTLIGGWFKNHPIPHLAKGGILTSPTAALLGEYAGARTNPEIATPQSLMYETMMKANGDMVGAFAQMTRQVIAAIENKDLSVSIGDEQVARSAQRGNTAYKNRTGKALLTI